MQVKAEHMVWWRSTYDRPPTELERPLSHLLTLIECAEGEDAAAPWLQKPRVELRYYLQRNYFPCNPKLMAVYRLLVFYGEDWELVRTKLSYRTLQLYHIFFLHC